LPPHRAPLRAVLPAFTTHTRIHLHKRLVVTPAHARGSETRTRAAFAHRAFAARAATARCLRGTRTRALHTPPHAPRHIPPPHYPSRRTLCPGSPPCALRAACLPSLRAASAVVARGCDLSTLHTSCGFYAPRHKEPAPRAARTCRLRAAHITAPCTAHLRTSLARSPGRASTPARTLVAPLRTCTSTCAARTRYCAHAALLLPAAVVRICGIMPLRLPRCGSPTCTRTAPCTLRFHALTPPRLLLSPRARFAPLAATPHRAGSHWDTHPNTRFARSLCTTHTEHHT